MNELDKTKYQVTKPLVTLDMGIAQAASSFFSPYNNKRDPRARASFERVATYYCNQAELNFHGPALNEIEFPILLNHWLGKCEQGHEQMIPLQTGVGKIITNALEKPIATFLEGNPVAVASWVEMQFTDKLIDQYSPVIDQIKERLLMVSGHAAHLIERGELERTLASFDKLNFIEPPVFESLIGKEGIQSLYHLAISLVLLHALRGRIHLYNLTENENISTLANHWIRSPAIKAPIPGETSETEIDDSKPLFPWGAIIRRVLEQEGDYYLSGQEERVIEALDIIRQIGHEHVEKINDTFLDRNENRINSNITTIIADCMVKAGIYPRYKSSKATDYLDKLLRSLIKSQSDTAENLSEIITTNVQPKWIRGIESKIRLKYRRESFWDVFDSYSIEPTIMRYGQKLTK